MIAAWRQVSLGSCWMSRVRRLSSSSLEYAVVVVGGGHAGVEAAAAAARMGQKTLLVTHKKSTIGEMSCNPSFGGVGKGTLIREIDAMDGLCGRVCDLAGIHFKMLNLSRGPAVWGPRAQMDRDLYRFHMQQAVAAVPNLTVAEGSCEELLTNQANEIVGLEFIDYATNSKRNVYARGIVITTGTFLRGETHLGLVRRPAGRIGDAPAVGLARSFERFGFQMGRLRTGTPPRVDKTSIDYTGLEMQHCDDPPRPFSFLHDRVARAPNPSVVCHMTRTSPEAHQIVLDTLHLNVHLKENVTGPRYCPSIESKVLRWGKERCHQVWLEPEGLSSPLVYPQGISMTMPAEAQARLLRLLPGLEHCRMVQPGYGVEYDFIHPTQLRATLETKEIKGLFLAGQINGTTGYEEAGAQGVIAGANAALCARGSTREFIVDRSDGYVGVMIDDLVTKGVSEPYRMFTSRSEFRLTLRSDNADSRLTLLAHHATHTPPSPASLSSLSPAPQSSLIGPARLARLSLNSALLRSAEASLNSDIRSPLAWQKLLNRDSVGEKNRCSALDLLEQPQMIEQFLPHFPLLNKLPILLRDTLEANARYRPYMTKQQKEIRRLKNDIQLQIPIEEDYSSYHFLSNEERAVLTQHRPHTLHAASTLQGITPSSLILLHSQLTKQRKAAN